MKQIKFIFIFALVLGCAVLLGMTPGNAQAAPLMSSWSFADDLEGDWSPWVCWQEGSLLDNACRKISSTANDYFRLETYNGVTTMGRKVTISPFDSQMSCKATMYIKPEPHIPAPFQGQLEVIDNNTWTYINLKTFSHNSTKSVWTTVTTTNWTPPSPDIFVRMGLNSTAPNMKKLQIDLLKISCTW